MTRLALAALPLVLPLALLATPAAAWCGSGAGAYGQTCERGVTVYRARTALPDPAVALAYSEQALRRNQLAAQTRLEQARLRLEGRQLRDARFNASRELALAEREQSLFYTRGFGGGYSTFGGYGGGFIGGGFGADPFLPPFAFRGFADTNQRPFPRTDVNRIARPGVRRTPAPATRIPGSRGHAPH